MTPLKPKGQIDLEHRAYFLRESKVLIAASAEGDVSLIDLASKTVRHSRPVKKLRAISPHPTKPLLAMVDGNSGSLVIQNLTGETIAQIEAPQIEPDKSGLIRRGFNECYFDESGDGLWCAAHLNDVLVEVVLIDTKDWSVIQRVTVKDEFSASSCLFHATGKPGLLTFWVAGGQDGQQVFWLNRNEAGFSVTRADEMENCTPPIFSPDGSEFLTLREDNSIYRYAFPSMKRCGPNFLSGEDIGQSIIQFFYLNSRYAMVGTGMGRVFLMDIKRMKIRDELKIEGHEVRPRGIYYTVAGKRRMFATDIITFIKFGKSIIFIFCRDQKGESKDWKDSLLWHTGSITLGR